MGKLTFVVPFAAFLLSTLFYVTYISNFDNFGYDNNRLVSSLTLYEQIPKKSIIFLGDSQTREDIDCTPIESKNIHV